MNHRHLLLAIDLGTSGVKAGVFASDGSLVAQSGVGYETLTPHPGWAEQEPQAWWDATCRAVSQCVAQCDATRIEGIGLTGLSPSLVCVDKRGEPVRPALIWSDRRVAQEISELTEALGAHLSFTPLPRLLWLKRHEPNSYERTRWVFDSFDYLSFKMTGQAASFCPVGDQLAWSPSDALSAGLALDKFPSRVCKLGEHVGGVLPAVAAQVGLPSGLPVIAGTIDSFAAWIGTATTRPGVVCNTVGTSDGVALVWDRALVDPQNRLQCMPHLTGRHWIVGGAMSTGGILLEWFVRHFYNHEPDSFGTAIREAEDVSVGADGLLALPYLMGERSPIFDHHARAVFFGISQTHGRAHFARAVLESVALAVRDVCHVIEEVGGAIDEIRVAGGGAKSDLWSQIKADVVGVPVLVPQIGDSGLLGAAIIAGWGVGRFTDLSEAAQAMVKFRAVMEPRVSHHEMYTKLFELYRRLYQHLKDDFVTVSQLLRPEERH